MSGQMSESQQGLYIVSSSDIKIMLMNTIFFCL
jgi:hypothetical protein